MTSPWIYSSIIPALKKSNELSAGRAESVGGGAKILCIEKVRIRLRSRRERRIEIDIMNNNTQHTAIGCTNVRYYSCRSASMIITISPSSSRTFVFGGSADCQYLK
jgi:hypothetical protein